MEQEAKVRQEFEAKQKKLFKRREEEKQRQEMLLKQQADMRKEIDDYIDHGSKTPDALRKVTNSQPGRDACPFFAKTGTCRYGDMCSRNHQRYSLTSMILIPGFYAHFSMEKQSKEYDTDISLEYESAETRKHFREFYFDVMPELKKYGKIKTMQYCCNSEIHLRGNLYVEYYSERDAAKAQRGLAGRWYAGRQLNCEFAYIKSWRQAICGMTKCPKGKLCNFMHTFRNPGNMYGVRSPPMWMKKASECPESYRSAPGRRSEQR